MIGLIPKGVTTIFKKWGIKKEIIDILILSIQICIGELNYNIWNYRCQKTFAEIA